MYAGITESLNRMKVIVMSQRLKILFLCTGNSCRSQMAEGWTRHLKGHQIEAYSAGVIAKGIDPLAVEAMAEAGIDISNQRSKPVEQVLEVAFDYVVTLCDHARESCPLFPGRARVVHRGFDDPPSLAAGAENTEKALAHYRRVRDQIRDFVARLPANLPDTLTCPAKRCL